jgi:hypothetical protein
VLSIPVLAKAMLPELLFYAPFIQVKTQQMNLNYGKIIAFPF